MSNIKLLHGDSYELIKDIPDKSVDCIYVDVPYYYESGGSGSSDIAKQINQYAKENLKEINIYDGFDTKIYDDFIRISKKVNIYIWCSRLQIVETLNYFVSKGYLFNILVWCKTNPIPATNNNWLSDIEYCLNFRESGCKLNDGYEFKSKWYVSPINQADKSLFKHPTIKPLEFVKRHLQHTTQEGDTVLDCFMGSGTTGVACKELNRDFIGIELDKEYYEIAKNRINGITADGQLSIFTDVDKMEQQQLFE